MERITSSGLKTDDAAIAAQGAYVHAVTIIPAAAASAVILYDNTAAASGTVLAKAQAVANGESVHIHFDCPVAANTGIYADVSGTDAAYIVYYSLA